MIKGEYKYSAMTEKIIGCAMKVHNTLGNGFQEVIYQRALAKELGKAGIDFAREVEMPIHYDGEEIGTRRADFLVDGKILVELKALTSLEDVHIAQGLNYLAAGETKTINVSFHPMSPGLKTGHIIFTHNAQSSPDTLLLYGGALNVDTTIVEVQTSWNLVSNPRIVSNDSVHVLFNSSIPPAFRYNQIEDYQSVQRMLNGAGYWLKFGFPQSINLSGVDILIDTINVNEGWNLIGSISQPVETSTIMQNPPGIVITDYFTYDSGYIPSNTFIPGKAYWVKVSQNGKLILTAP